MTVTIDPSDMRPASRPRLNRPRLAARQVLLAGVGALALVAFTAGAFSFFSGLADPRAKPARPSPVAAAWPELKDGVPALTPRSAGEPGRVSTATILNLPRPDETGPAAGTEFRLREAPPAQAEAAPVASSAARPAEAAPAKPADVAVASPVPSSIAASPPPAAPAPAAAVPPSAKPLAAAPVRKPPPQIENAEIVTSEAKPAPVLAPTRTAAPIAPSRAESIRARSAEPSAFVSLPAEPEPAPPASARTDPARPVAAMPAVKSAAAKPVAAKPAAIKPVAATSRPVQAVPAPKPVVQAAPASAPVRAAAATAAQDADDPEVMGVRIPGSRHVRDGWKAVFGGTQQN